MAITSSAKKALRASERKHLFNVRRKRALTNTTKEVRKLITPGQTSEKGHIETSLSAAFQAIDKAAKRGIIKKNTASRRKSRLAKAVAKATS